MSLKTFTNKFTATYFATKLAGMDYQLNLDAKVRMYSDSEMEYVHEMAEMAWKRLHQFREEN